MSNLKTIHAEFEEDGQRKLEAIQAMPIEEASPIFQIREAPSVVYNLNMDDIVLCRPIANHPQVHFLIIQRVYASGNKTIRFIVHDQHIESIEEATIVNNFLQNGILIWNTAPGYYTVNVHPHQDFESIFNYLQNLEDRGVLQFELGMTYNPDTALAGGGKSLVH